MLIIETIGSSGDGTRFLANS